jgi:ATP-dependent exoDNAse (exonuclease V) beta subunit
MQGVPPESAELPEDAVDRRRAATHVHESLAVEAGAGTGKTTLLVSRIVNLLRGGRSNERPAKMGEIVAITFTEKAAGELKTRLRTVLEEAVVAGRFGDEPLSGAESARLRDALEDLDRAVVSTIHSFCASLIRERPVEAGIDPGRTTADAVTQSLLFDEAWERWRGEALENADDAVLAAALRSNVKADRSSPSDRSPSLRDLAATLVANRDLLEHLPAPIDEQAEWDKWKPVIDEHCDAMKKCLRHTKKHNEEVDKPSRLAYAFIKLWDSLRTKSPGEAREVLRTEPEEPNEELRGQKARWRDQSKLEELKSLLAALYNRILPDVRAILTHNLTVELSRRIAEFVASYEALKAERGLLDFQDMLLIARDMLRKSDEARDYFRQRFRHLLIDEFQDTDPLQAEVAGLLSSVWLAAHDRASGETETRRAKSTTDTPRSPLANHHTLFLVGDPKQSIYRFRRADIEFYDQCTRQLGDEQRVRIRQNFRSGTRIINWVNRVFG